MVKCDVLIQMRLRKDQSSSDV